jgi:hypothetical protein
MPLLPDPGVLPSATWSGAPDLTVEGVPVHIVYRIIGSFYTGSSGPP